MELLKMFKFVLIFCLIFNVVDMQERRAVAAYDENYTERYIELQFAYSRLQLEFYKLHKQMDKCKCNKNNTTTVVSNGGNTVTFQSIEENINKLPKNCVEATKKQSGIYELQELKNGSGSVRVACDFETQGGGWMIIQRRINGTVNFNRSWQDYKQGFGNIEHEYWLGLDNIYMLTKNADQEILILLEDHDKQKRWAHYKSFAIGDESEMYIIKSLGPYTGDAGDSLSGHLSDKFSTYDRDHDTWLEGNCANNYQSGWWFSRCLTSNLNGPNLVGEFDKTQCCRGIHWLAFRGEYYSLKSSTMMIRPKDYKP